MRPEDLYEDSATSGRSESPAIEHAFQRQVVRALTELLETKGMYQNVRIDESIFADLQPGFSKEFRCRPISPVSRGEGDDQKMDGTRIGGAPFGAADEDRDAGFYLPNIVTDCVRCKKATTFLSMQCSGRVYYQDPYPLKGVDTEQVFNLYYRCATCRDAYIVFQVLRKGFKFQLTGRSVPYRPTIGNEWPKEIKQIVEDAYVAAAEGDLPAAYYHLRTAVEFYLKGQLNVTSGTKIEGSDLCDRYNAQVDERLKMGIPTFGPIYAELSAGLHSREVDAVRFNKLSRDFLGHLKAKELFSQYAQ
jgi:hypothetical protein